MLLIGDPSTHTAVTPGSTRLHSNTTVTDIALAIEDGTGPQAAASIMWDDWAKAACSERPKANVDAITAAWVETGE